MNFRHMPELEWRFGYAFALGTIAGVGAWRCTPGSSGRSGGSDVPGGEGAVRGADDGSLTALKSATVSAEWELTPGATDLRGALDQIDAERPHVMVAFGPFEDLVAIAGRAVPGDADRDGP